MEKIARSIPVTRPYKLPLESNKWGGAYFDGASSIRITDNVTLDITDAITLMITAKSIDNTADGVNSRRSLGKNLAYHLFNDSKYNGRLYIGGVAKSINTVTSTTVNNIFNQCMTYDKDAGTNNQIIYLNGISLNSLTVIGAIDTNANDLFIGSLTSSTARFKGTIYYAIVIAQVLTQPQIQDLMYGRILPTQFDCRLWHDYRLGHARDLSGNGNHGTINGNVRFV